jgi:hypothetical protein
MVSRSRQGRTGELAGGLIGAGDSLRHGVALRLARDARVLDEAREGRVGHGLRDVGKVLLHLRPSYTIQLLPCLLLP